MSRHNYARADSFEKLSRQAKKRRIDDDSSLDDSSHDDSSHDDSSVDDSNAGSKDEANVSFSQALPQSRDDPPSADPLLSSPSPRLDNPENEPYTQPDLSPSPDLSSEGTVDTSASDWDENSDFHISSSGSSVSDDDIIPWDQDAEDENDVIAVERSVREWAIAHNVTNSATSDLLRRLRDSHPECFALLHIDARTILGTPAGKVPLDDIPPGKYYHIGIKKHLPYILSLLPVTVMELFMAFNIDGFPLKESVFSESWPISVCFPTFPVLRNLVFPIAIFAGCEKPEDVNAFLRRFVDELKDLVENGFQYRDRLISIKVLGFCGDTPARSFAFGTVGHGGFFCCPWCEVEGVTYLQRRIYLEVDCRPRTDADFRSRKDPNYRPPDKSTILEEIRGFDFVKSLILDPMHLLFQGVMKRLLSEWLHGKIPYKLSVVHRQALLKDIQDVKIHIPSFFTRKLEAIKISKKKDKISIKWKAKEFRLFLLYVGPVVMKKYLTSEKYNHLLELHIATLILFCPKTCADVELRKYAHSLLVHFVETTPNVYGPELVVFTFHALIHLVAVADNFCQYFPNFSLNDLSTFPFENFLRKLKKLARGPAKSLQQISKRMEERSRCKAEGKLFGPGPSLPEELVFRIEHNDGPLLPSLQNPQFKKAVSVNFNLSISNAADCYCRLSGACIVKVENFAFSAQGDKVLIGRKFLDLTSFYSDPYINSTELGVFKGQRLSIHRFWAVSKISEQYFGIPDGQGDIVLFPLLHCLV